MYDSKAACAVPRCPKRRARFLTLSRAVPRLITIGGPTVLLPARNPGGKPAVSFRPVLRRIRANIVPGTPRRKTVITLDPMTITQPTRRLLLLAAD